VRHPLSFGLTWGGHILLFSVVLLIDEMAIGLAACHHRASNLIFIVFLLKSPLFPRIALVSNLPSLCFKQSWLTWEEFRTVFMNSSHYGLKSRSHCSWYWSHWSQHASIGEVVWSWLGSHYYWSLLCLE
jgi:hypothetical protein